MITSVSSIAVAAALVMRTSYLWSYISLPSFHDCFIYDLTCEMKKFDAWLMLQSPDYAGVVPTTMVNEFKAAPSPNSYNCHSLATG